MLFGAFITSCGAEEEAALLAPEIIMSAALAEDIDQVDFWVYNIIDSEKNPLTCDRLTISGKGAIDPLNPLYKIIYYNTMVFYQDREVKKEYKNVPTGTNYIIYARGYEVNELSKQKFVRAQGCNSGVNILPGEVTAITIDLSAASAN